MKTQVPLPLAKYAFDDAATRELWSKSFRLTLVNFLVRSVIWVALLVTAMVGPDRDGSQTVTGLAAFLSMITAFLLIRPARKLQWTLLVARVLKSGPWRGVTAVRRADVKLPSGVAVELLFGDGDGDGDGEDAEDAADGPVGKESRVVAARTWRRRVPWPDEASQKCWVVTSEDPRLPSVLARPGGFDPLTLHRAR
ncbi:hypothetical protein RCO28_10250 [Streptomyces sp. LHD-70]|uniref:hypothetical protein n=1 Tax=Streptomyces sp. LHD-70 TaxID=3072140 RepID=UPI0028106983|nr:hypothetical protein [Streptomyces sp. LHD-70]MDQ8702868.1 hypothetical protein [Streptomyces sp. LHD-70]